MSNEIIMKVKKGLEGIEIGYFDTGQYFEKEAYYQYFGDPDKEIRRYAIAVFTVYLGNWYSRSRYPFLNAEQDLENYIKAFIKCHEQIHKDFPVMHEYILFFLTKLEEVNNEECSIWTLKIGKELHDRLKKEVLIPKRKYINKNTPMKYFLREIRVNPFFYSDFIEGK